MARLLFGTLAMRGIAPLSLSALVPWSASLLWSPLSGFLGGLLVPAGIECQKSENRWTVNTGSKIIK